MKPTKEKFIKELFALQLPAIPLRSAFTSRFLDYDVITKIVEKSFGLDPLTIRKYARDFERIENELNELFEKHCNSRFGGSICCRLIEMGEIDLLCVWLSYEVAEDEPVEGPDLELSECEICGKETNFTQNMCEDCFDDETDKLYEDNE